MSEDSKSHDELLPVKHFWSELGIDHYMYERDDAIILSKFVVPKNRRKHGIGSAAMRRLTIYADSKQKIIALSPSLDFGATSINRLCKFYRRFGFVRNMGRSKDYTLSYTMYRSSLLTKV
jgi:GNAT superfamily N-acetyltransferase